MGFAVSSSSFFDLDVGDRIMFFSEQFAPGCAQAGLQEYAIVDTFGATMCKFPEG